MGGGYVSLQRHVLIRACDHGLWSYVCAVRVRDYTCMGVMVGTTRWFVCWCPRDASNNWFTGNCLCVCVCAYRGPCSWMFCCEACCLRPVDCLHWSLQPSAAASATHCGTKVTQSRANDKSISLRLIRKHCQLLTLLFQTFWIPLKPV